MSQPAPSERVELKYCEGCGCLLTRAIGSGLAFCSSCEAKQSKDEMYLRRPAKRSSAGSARLPNGIDPPPNENGWPRKRWFGRRPRASRPRPSGLWISTAPGGRCCGWYARTPWPSRRRSSSMRWREVLDGKVLVRNDRALCREGLRARGRHGGGISGEPSAAKVAIGPGRRRGTYGRRRGYSRNGCRSGSSRRIASEARVGAEAPGDTWI